MDKDMVHYSAGRSEHSSPERVVTTGARERPILFSGPMVCALLAGRKTQTRRIVKGPALDWLEDFDPAFVASPGNHLCPYGSPGDLLWVRESGLENVRARDFRLFAHDAAPGRYWVDSDGGRNGASCGSAITRASMIAAGGWKVRPSIHMPRWASRLRLAVTEVRIQRLQDISEDDAKAEGSQEPTLVPIIGACWSERDAYAKLWEHINGPGSWATNPWVWAVSFKVCGTTGPSGELAHSGKHRNEPNPPDHLEGETDG